MSNRFDFGAVNLQADKESTMARPTSETPFCIAVLGDFSGRVNRGIFEPKTIGERRSYLVDRDNFDEVMSKLHPELHLPTGSKIPLMFHFSELDDFHPDQLFENEAFQKLKDIRGRLQDPATFQKTAEQLGWLHERPSSAPVKDSARVTPPNPMRLSSGSLLDEMIEQTESRIALEPRHRSDEVHEFARQLAAKYAVSAPDARQPEVIAAVDRAIGDSMRTILHDTDFQALEAIWRSTFLLVRHLETGANLRILLIDISKQELAADLSATSDLRSSAAFRLLVEKTVETPGADPFTIMVGAYRFGSVGGDMEWVPKLAAIAQGAGAVLLAEADPMLVGCSFLERTPSPRDWKPPESQDSWSGVRSRPEAASFGMAMPRFLLRLPYGADTSPLESFEFEEFSGPPLHEGYLWGNPAFGLALMLGESFSDAGWEMRPGTMSQLEKLPLHTFRVEGDLQSKPCAEVLLTEEAVDRILDRGLIPLVSYKGRDAVRVARFQSVADPQQPLRGRWWAS
jgi:type VI secretion system protein ImpC